MAFVSKFTGPEIDRRLAQGTYDDAVAAGFTGTKEQFDAWIAAYTPQEMEKLNNKQDKEDPMLETENKTVVGAINLLNSEKQDKEDERLATESKIVVDAINELNTRTTDLYYNKQDKEDSSLATEQKTVVGAINELKLGLQEQDSQKQDKVDDGFATNDKSVVGAVNEVHNELDAHVADYNKHVDEYEAFKADAENTLNSHSTQIGQLTQEKQDKTDFNLATESKTVVGAINENYAAINAEVARAVAEDARLEEVKVSYTDISDSSNPDRKTIMLKNHDSLSGYGTDGTTAYNLAMVSKWDKADFGAAGIPINLNGSEAHPTYNDKEEFAFVSDLSGETGKLAEDIKTLNETVAIVKQDLADSVSSINKNMEDGFNTINDDIDNEIRPAIEKNAKDIGVVNSTLTTKINETEEKLQADINHLKPRVTTLESLQIVKVDSDSETYSASYELQDVTGKVYGQRINIATDKFIKSVSYANQVLTIVFVLEDGSEYSQNIDVSELMNVYTAGGGITITETGVVSISDDTLQMIQYSDSEVRRLEKDKIPYAYDEKTQSNINVILPEGGSYLGNYGDENATVAKAAVYDGTKQLELGSSKVHTNINTDSDVTIETSTGKKTIATTDELVNVVNIPIRSLKDKVYTQSEILDWFGVISIPELKQKISRGSQMYLRYGILLSGNPMYYKMPIEYTAFESANQIKLVFVGLNTRDDVTSKYEILINLDGTIIEGNSNIKVTITSIEPEDIDLSEYATKEELNDYALKSELPDTSNFATKSELNAKQDTLVSGTNIKTLNGVSLLGEGNIQLDEGPTDYETLTNKPSINSVELSGNLSFEDLGLDVNTTWDQIQNKPEFATVATSGDYDDLTNTPNLTVYQTISDNSLTTSAKTIPGAINEIKNSVDSISDPYEINLTNLLSAKDSESISTAISGIDNLNATVQDNRIIVGTISNGSVSVSIRILGNVTTLYYLLDSVLGLTLNEVAITNTSGTLSKSVTTHSVLTENMVINSLNSDETTLPLSAAQGKALNTDKQSKTDNTLNTTDKTVVGAINEILPKATGVGKVDSDSDGTGEIFNSYSGSFANKATGEHSHAEGSKTTASGNFSHAEGASNTASGTYSHAEGSSNRATGQCSHAEGDANTATGRASHAEGYNNNATGQYSHAEGNANTATGRASHAEGRGTEAFSEGEHAEGSYNKSYSSENSSIRVIHSVGIGSSTSDEKNAHEIKFNGDHYVYGLGNFDGTNSADAQTLQEVINSKQSTLTAGTGIEITPENQINVTLDTNVFFVAETVPESPSDAQKKKICLVPADTTEEGNFYTEYVWVVDDTHPDGYWEEFGTYKSEVDLTPYLKTVDAQATYATKTELAAHTTSTENPHEVTAAQVGLGNVDNTSDEDKPISTATQAALNLKQNITDNSLETTSKTVPGAINETKTRIDNIDQTLDLKKIFAYGVEWTDEEILTSSALHRIGNLQMHKDLPIQSSMYGCIVKNGALQYKLGATNWAYKEDMVTSSVLDGTDGGIYIHVPKFYLWSENEGTTHRVYISLLPLVPDALEVPEMYVSAEKVTLDRSDSSNIRTASVVNTTANFRGGNNKTDYDTYLTTDPARCLLGKPATNISRANMRTYARNASEELLCYDWYKALYWLYVIEYGNFNCQLAYNAELTAEGYKQGGLGNGVTTLNWNSWKSYNSNNPIVPCGYNYEIGNGTGVKSLTLTGYNENAGATVSVPRWRGLCSPFGDIWTNVEGAYIQQMAEGADYKLVYGTHNPKYFGETNEHMDYLGEEVRSEGYITSFSLKNLAHIIPLTVTNSNVGMCDHHDIGNDDTNARSLFMGGSAHCGSQAGFGCWRSEFGLADAYASVGFRTVIVK